MSKSANLGTSIERLIRQAIRAKCEPDISEVSRLLRALSCEELDRFWSEFLRNVAFSSANRVPDLMTKKAETTFMEMWASYSFPLEKTQQNYEQFLLHVNIQTIRYIGEQRAQRHEAQQRSLIEKGPRYVGLTVLVLVLPFTVCLLLSENRVFPHLTSVAILTFTVLWGLYIAVSLICSATTAWRARRQSKIIHSPEEHDND